MDRPPRLVSPRIVACCLVSFRRRGGIVIRMVGGGAMVAESWREARRRMDAGRWSAIPVQDARRLYGDGDAGRAGDGQGMQQ
jgi:hypothetical protein